MRGEHRPPIWAAQVLVGLIVAACSGSATLGASSAAVLPSASPQAVPSSASSPGGPSPSPSAASSKGPASAQIAIVGTAGLTGPVTAQTISCNRPALQGGPEISYIGQAANGPQIVIFAQAGHVEVRVGTGAASTLRLRTFVGNGVTSFDAAIGVVVDTKLTETTDPGAAVGTLGALSSISGSIDCGNQQPGSADVVVSGVTPYGQLSGALTNVAVTCTVIGPDTYVGINGLSTAGATPVLMFVTASTGALQVAVETGSAGTFYTGKGAGLTTLEPNGATMSGDVTESVAKGSSPSPNLLHVTGTATCGVTVHQ
jgi:hypothetical protein